jgi:hypothetical protein
MTARTVAEKLQVKPGSSVFLVPDFASNRDLVGPLPDNARFEANDADVAIVFVATHAELTTRFRDLLPEFTGLRAVWFCYRKANKADLNRTTLIEEAPSFGWDTVANVAIDDEWSAVRIRPLTAQ